MSESMTQWVGWGASIVLCLTLASQLRAQWIAKSSEGVSPLLYIGQIFASLGFTVYSVLLKNYVFIVTNALLMVAAMVGLSLWFRYRESGSDESKAKEAEATDSTISGPPSGVAVPADASMGGRRWSFNGIRRRFSARGRPVTGRWG